MTSRLTQPTIRRIRPQDADGWREVRLRALLDAPDAFGSTHTETVQRPPEAWTTRAARSSEGDRDALFLADGGPQLVGLVGGYRSSDDDHMRQLYSMWVAPDFRGTGLAERLVDHVVDWATTSGASRLDLWVTSTNGQAIRFYERLSFEATGRRQQVRPGSDLDELEMTLELRIPREVN
jgi:ribosomal protein S18 acetylase RimI-like enzyme